MPLLLSPTSFFLLLIVVVGSQALRPEAESEQFSEALLLRPLADGKLLAHFRFRTAAPSSSSPHHRLFPKSISHLIRRFSLRDLELSFTQGRWSYHRWGSSGAVPAFLAKPPGVELRTSDLPDAAWRDLTHALSGLFCASINFLDSPASHARPRWASARYGALPREAVCTENLTPWLKLLPCRDKAGLASLLHRASIYRASYHSQRLRLALSPSGTMFLEQTLTLVLLPPAPHWTIRSLFAAGMRGRCVLASSSAVFVELEPGLVRELDGSSPRGSWAGSAFELSRLPDEVTDGSDDGHGNSSVLYGFDVFRHAGKEEFDLGFSWKRHFSWSPSQALLLADRFLMGSGNERGTIAIRFLASQSHELLSRHQDGCRVDAAVLQIVPWYVKVYYHTLKIFVDGKAQDVFEVVERFQVAPSEDKLSPGVMELLLKLPCGMKSAVLTIDFDKGFLHIDEYPPDANQGFDIPSAVVTYPNFTVHGNIFKGTFVEKEFLMDGVEERSPVRSYTEILLVPLTTPDFSMPYNVITFTCTVLALYFGSLLNVLRRRVGEEERLLGKDATRQGILTQLLSKLASKLRRKAPESSSSPFSQPLLNTKQLMKVVLVAIAAVLWYYFQNDR